MKECFCSTSHRKPQSEEKEESVPNYGAFLPFFFLMVIAPKNSLLAELNPHRIHTEALLPLLTVFKHRAIERYQVK